MKQLYKCRNHSRHYVSIYVSIHAKRRNLWGLPPSEMFVEQKTTGRRITTQISMIFSNGRSYDFREPVFCEVQMIGLMISL